MTAAAWVCLASPLAASLLITLGGTTWPRRVTGYIATLSTAVSFVAAAICFFALTGREDEERSVETTAWSWLQAGDLDVGLTLLVDPLSVLMMLIVSGVGSLIVGYSIGYMDGEDEERRFFAYMALFVFSMLLLVEAGNFLMLLVGWGLVGLCSYLLIGFWHHRPSAIAAAKKAFIMNAFGDATMALAFFLLIQRTGSLDFAAGFDWADGAEGSWAVNLVALGLLGGAVAKSAQIPLQTWLPDAMEGPTPVSALIHAATMVVAGVFLLVRTAPVFEAADGIQNLAAGLGAATLLLAALVALVQTNIKRVIAYSTMSQIGYMFLGAGVGAYGNGMFHLMTHAFFKALLFLAAGIVIHSLLAEEDMRKMGGLRHLLPRTCLAFVIGALALSGLPPFAGFFSKDSVLASALAAGTYGQVLFVAGLLGVFLTGLYAFRMVFMVFGGEPSAYAREHFHAPGRTEPAFWMAWTVGTLAVLSVVGGWIQFAILWTPVEDFLSPVVEPLVEPSVAEDVVTSVLASFVSIAGIALAWAIYSARRIPVPSLRPIRALLERKFYFDEAYDWAFYRPAVWTARAFRGLVEQPLIAGSLAGVALGARRAGGEVAETQTGLVRTYAFVLAAGVAALGLIFVWVR